MENGGGGGGGGDAQESHVIPVGLPLSSMEMGKQTARGLQFWMSHEGGLNTVSLLGRVALDLSQKKRVYFLQGPKTN